jgi:hypothetical protein
MNQVNSSKGSKGQVLTAAAALTVARSPFPAMFADCE